MDPLHTPSPLSPPSTPCTSLSPDPPNHPDTWPHSSWTKPLLYPSTSLAFLAPTPPRLDILIAGAGIAGLSAAIALRLQHHSVTILEASPAANEVGAGIQIPPNASRLLQRWGVLAHLLPHTTCPESWVMRRWDDGRLISVVRHLDYEGDFGGRYYVIHRAHYHAGLHKRAEELGVQIRMGSRVARYFEGGVHLADGAVLRADLVVGADGVRSAARGFVNGRDIPPMNTGYVAYRVTIDLEQVDAQGQGLGDLVDGRGMDSWWGPGRHVVSYRIRGGKALNLVLAVPDKTTDTKVADRNEVDAMRAHYSGWDPKFQALISKTTSALKWPTLAVPPLQTWLSPEAKVVIIGDAAHGMLPFMAQGAAVAVEDAAALAQAVSWLPENSLHTRLHLFEKVRMRRAHAMQQCSDLQAYIWHMEDGEVQRRRDEAMQGDLQGRVGPSPNQMVDEVARAWVYGHDAEGEMRAEMAREFGG